MRLVLRCSSILALMVVLVAACGGGKAGTSGVNAQDLLSRSATKFGTVKTFHFKLEHEKGSIPIVLGLRLVTAEGDTIVPNRLSADVQAKIGQTAVRVKVIGIDDKTWITNPFTRDYQRLPGDSPISSVVDPAGLATSVARSLQDARVEGMEVVDGIDCYHISGTLASDALIDSLTFATAGRTVKVDAWIGKDDSLLHKARIKGPLVQDEDAAVVRQITLSRFDAVVSIEPPQ
jgi:hypothetical protein